MDKPARYVILGIFVVVVLLAILLALIYISGNPSLRDSFVKNVPGGSTSGGVTYEIASEDKSVNLELSNYLQLEIFGKDFSVGKNTLVAIPVVDENGVTEVDWIKADKITFVYKPGLEGTVLVEGQTKPQLIFDVERSKFGNGALVYFDYVPLKKLPEGDNLNRGVSAAVVQLLYRVTHYLPNAEYDYDELSLAMEDITENHIVIVNKTNQ